MVACYAIASAVWASGPLGMPHSVLGLCQHSIMLAKPSTLRGPKDTSVSYAQKICSWCSIIAAEQYWPNSMQAKPHDVPYNRHVHIVCMSHCLDRHVRFDCDRHGMFDCELVSIGPKLAEHRRQVTALCSCMVFGRP